MWSIGILLFLLILVMVVAVYASAGRLARDAEYHGHLPRTMTLTSGQFAHGSKIPVEFSGDGQGGSPALTWSNIPPNTRSFVLLMTDDDIPSPRLRAFEFVHWVVYNLPAHTRGLPERISSETLAGMGAVEGVNGFGRQGYYPPAPPRISPSHRYLFRIYALDVPTIAPRSARKHDVLTAMRGHILAYGHLIGLYR